MSPSQSLVYSYDARNRLESVVRTVDGAPPQTTTYAYDAAGNRREMTGADGTRTEYAYDARHRLASLVKRTAAGALLVGMSYTVDASGLRTALTESDPAGTTRTVAYAYDALKRLTAETITHRDPTRHRSSTWTYDRVGNRLTQTVATGEGTVGAASAATTYTYDPNDRLLTESTTLDANPASVTTYTYDPNGNTVQKATPSGPIEYSYDDANRLTEMRQAGERTTYAYDADGLRVGQTRHPATGDPITTRWLQDPTYAYSQVIEQWRREGTGPTTLEASYAFADDLIAQTRYAGAAATTAHAQMDGFGSVRWLTDAAGAVTDAIEYDAFGNEIHRSGSTPTEHLYRGEQFDANLGFYYLRARWMNPGAGRFATGDRWRGLIRQPYTHNRYTYANSSPTAFADPSGLCGLDDIGTPGFGRAVEKVVEAQYTATHAFQLVEFGKCQWTGGGYLKPDVFNFTARLLNEIKPLSPDGIYQGFRQMDGYILAFGPGGAFGDLDFSPDVDWTPLPSAVNGRRVYYVNVDGIIFYTDDERLWTAAATATSEADLRRSLRTASRQDTFVGADAAANAALVAFSALTISYAGFQTAQLVANVLTATMLRQ